MIWKATYRCKRDLQWAWQCVKGQSHAGGPLFRWLQTHHLLKSVLIECGTGLEQVLDALDPTTFHGPIEHRANVVHALAEQLDEGQVLPFLTGTLHWSTHVLRLSVVDSFVEMKEELARRVGKRERER